MSLRVSLSPVFRYLLDHGANVSSVNNDGELAIDISESDEMEELLQTEIDARGIDAEASRNTEERLMMEDARRYKQLSDKRSPASTSSKSTAMQQTVRVASSPSEVFAWTIKLSKQQLERVQIRSFLEA